MKIRDRNISPAMQSDKNITPEIDDQCGKKDSNNIPKQQTIEIPSAKISQDGVDIPAKTSMDIPNKKLSLSIQPVHSLSISRNFDTNKSNRRKSTLTTQQQKWNKFFKIISILCVFLFWCRVVTAACSLTIWNRNPTLAAEIAKPWDRSRSLIYQTAKLFVKFQFIKTL